MGDWDLGPARCRGAGHCSCSHSHEAACFDAKDKSDVCSEKGKVSEYRLVGMVSLIRAPTTLTSESKALKQSSLFVVAMRCLKKVSQMRSVLAGVQIQCSEHHPQHTTQHGTSLMLKLTPMPNSAHGGVMRGELR